MSFFGQSGPEDAAAGGSVGGISAPIVMDTSGVDAGLAKLRTGLDQAGAEITRLEAKMASSARWTDRWMVGMGAFGAEAGRSTYKLQVFAQTFDDLQYVPEQGLRPILNNIVQISPAIGIAVIAVQGLVTALGGLEGISKRLFSESGTGTEAELMDKLAKNTKRSADETKILNQHKKEQQQIEAMLGGQSAKEKATASAVQEAFDESDAEAVVQGIMASRTTLEHDKHLPGAIARKTEQLATARRVMAGGGTDEEITGYGAGGPAAAIERLKGELNDLARKLMAARRKDAEDAMLAAKKDPTALLREMERNPQNFDAGVISRFRDATPDAESRRLIAEGEAGAAAYDAKVKERGLERDFAEGQAEAAAEEFAKAQADEGMGIVNQGVENLKEENARREALNAEKNRAFRGNIDDVARLKERGSDLDWRLRLLTNPERRGQSLSLDAFESSIKATSGVSEEVKRLHAIWEVNKEIRDNTKKLKAITRIPR